MYNQLVNAHLKLHFLFNGWITHSSKYSFTNIYIHYFNYQDKVINYLIALPEQLSRYTGINYAAVQPNLFRVIASDIRHTAVLARD